MNTSPTLIFEGLLAKLLSRNTARSGCLFAMVLITLSGIFSSKQAINHPQRNIITRAIGTEENVEVDLFEIRKDEYDFFLLCSDGLSNEVNLEIIKSFNMQEKELQNICEKLVENAKINGGRDNITVMLFGGEV